MSEHEIERSYRLMQLRLENADICMSAFSKDSLGIIQSITQTFLVQWGDKNRIHMLTGNPSEHPYLLAVINVGRPQKEAIFTDGTYWLAVSQVPKEGTTLTSSFSEQDLYVSQDQIDHRVPNYEDRRKLRIAITKLAEEN